MRGLAILAAAALAILSVLPAQAKRKPPADPLAQVCELDWDASLGRIELKQTWSGAGEVTREELGIWRNDGRGGIISLSRQSTRIDGKDHTTQNFYFSHSGRHYSGKNQRLVIALPDGEILSVAVNAAGTAALSEAQLTRLIAAKGWLLFRVITVNRRGAEKSQIISGWMDLSGFAGQPLGGLLQTADRARTILAQARNGENPPCVMAEAAEKNEMDSEEPTFRALSFDCHEAWEGRLGLFELRKKKYKWSPGRRYGVELSIDGEFRPGPIAELQQFIIAPDDPWPYGRIWLKFGAQDWGANYRSTDAALRERQSVELHRGRFIARDQLSSTGSADFSWREYSQIILGDGDLEFIAFDKVTGATRRITVPWADVLAVEKEFQDGLGRLNERERDPMSRCKAVVDEEHGMEQIIVT